MGLHRVGHNLANKHTQNIVLRGSAFSEGNRKPHQLFQQRKFNAGNNLNRLWRIEKAERKGILR